MLIKQEIDNFIMAVGYVILIGVEYVKIAWIKWQNI